MIKVCHVITDYNVGGAGKWVVNYLSKQDTKAFKIFVALPAQSQLRPLLEKYEVTIIPVEGMAETSFDGKMIGYFVTLFKQNNFQVVHTHASLTARIAGKVAKVPCLVNSKHCLDEGQVKGLKKWVKARMNHYLSDQMIAVSEAVEKQMLDQGIHKNKICRVYNGVDPLMKVSKEEVNAYKKAMGIPEAALVVGIFARLEPVKHHVMLLEAFKALALKGKHKEVYLLIAGTGSQEAALKGKVKALGIEEKVIFTGHLEDVTLAMNLVDINVISSNEEALCLSLIEGMTLSKPSVGTNVGGIVEVIDHNKTGILVERGSVAAMTEALEALIEDPSLAKKMGKCGEEKALRMFKAAGMCRSVNRLYKTVLEEKNERK